MTERSTDPSLPSSAPPVSPTTRAWIPWAVTGAVIGLLTGMVSITVGGYTNDAIKPREVATVSVFGLTVHQETVEAGSWAGRLWGVALSGVFVALGAATGTALCLFRRRTARRTPPETDAPEQEDSAEDDYI